MATPKAVFLLLADAHKISPIGKIDVFGLFTAAGAWGFPAQRVWTIVAAFQNVSEGKHSFSVWVRPPSGKARKVGHGQFAVSSRANTYAYMAHHTPIPIAGPGKHSVGIALGDKVHPQGVAWCPIDVAKMPWPETPPPDKLKEYLSDPASVKMTRVVVSCPKCSRRYTFHVNLDPEAPRPKGTLAFPESGVFRCKRCSTPLYLKDLEGQARSQLGQRVTPPKGV